MARTPLVTMVDVAESRQELRTETNTQISNAEANFVELYANVALCALKLRPETVAGSSRALSLAELTGTTLTNNLQTASADVSLTIAAPVVAGMEWNMIIAVTLDTAKFWKLTLPVGASFLFNGTMGTNGGSVTFTAPARGTTATCKAITIGTGVVVIIESAATTITVA